MCRAVYSIGAAAMALSFMASSAYSQTGKMNNEQQEWFLCLISKEWCVARSVDQAGEEKAIAMVAAKGPLQLRSGISRVTLQIGCSNGKPVTILHSGREIRDPAISLRYTFEPIGRSAEVTAKNVGAGHFFEFVDQEFVQDIKNATAVHIQVKLTTGDSSVVVFNVIGGAKAVEKLNCASLRD